MHAGDAADIRSHAATLRRVAEDTVTVTDRLERDGAATTFEGPAAERLRASMADRTQRLRAAARELEDLADIVIHDRPATAG
jgi:hypothetical protein